jgi:carbon starvation protein
MNTLWIVILSVLTIYLAYNLYAKRIDRNVIQPDAKRATPARMYMDGVDFMPTNRNCSSAITSRRLRPPGRL